MKKFLNITNLFLGVNRGRTQVQLEAIWGLSVETQLIRGLIIPLNAMACQCLQWVKSSRKLDSSFSTALPPTTDIVSRYRNHLFAGATWRRRFARRQAIKLGLRRRRNWTKQRIVLVEMCPFSEFGAFDFCHFLYFCWCRCFSVVANFDKRPVLYFLGKIRRFAVKFISIVDIGLFYRTCGKNQESCQKKQRNVQAKVCHASSIPPIAGTNNPSVATVTIFTWKVPRFASHCRKENFWTPR